MQLLLERQRHRFVHGETAHEAGVLCGLSNECARLRSARRFCREPAAAPRRDGEAAVFEFRLNRDDGVETWVRSVGKRFLGADGKPERLVNLFKDITDRRRQTEAVENLAFRDPLTGLPNRAYFQRKFQEAVDASEMAGEIFGLIMIDVDHFKDINDTLGHDALLRRLADVLRHAFRSGDTVDRKSVV